MSDGKRLASSPTSTAAVVTSAPAPPYHSGTGRASQQSSTSLRQTDRGILRARSSSRIFSSGSSRAKKSPTVSRRRSCSRLPSKFMGSPPGPAAPVAGARLDRRRGAQQVVSPRGGPIRCSATGRPRARPTGTEAAGAHAGEVDGAQAANSCWVAVQRLATIVDDHLLVSPRRDVGMRRHREEIDRAERAREGVDHALGHTLRVEVGDGRQRSDGIEVAENVGRVEVALGLEPARCQAAGSAAAITNAAVSAASSAQRGSSSIEMISAPASASIEMAAR